MPVALPLAVCQHGTRWLLRLCPQCCPLLMGYDAARGRWSLSHCKQGKRDGQRPTLPLTRFVKRRRAQNASVERMPTQNGQRRAFFVPFCHRGCPLARRQRGRRVTAWAAGARAAGSVGSYTGWQGARRAAACCALNRGGGSRLCGEARLASRGKLADGAELMELSLIHI